MKTAPGNNPPANHSLFGPLRPAVTTLIVLVNFLLLLLLLSRQVHEGGPAVFGSFAGRFYLPDKNLFKAKEIAGLSPMLLVYLLFVLSAAEDLLLEYFTGKKTAGSRPCLPGSLARTGLTVLLGLTFLQMTGHSAEYRMWSGKTTAEKIALHYDKSRRFAQYARLALPGKHTCRAVTDLNLETGPGMMTYFAAAYYLYPVDIRLDPAPGDDCLVVFCKSNPREAVPEGYTVIPPFDEKSLIAVRKRNAHAE